MNKHHPSSEQLTSFASGGMSTHYAAAISTHIEFCEQCRANTKKLENIGGVSFERLEQISVSATLKDKLFSQIDSLANSQNSSHENSQTKSEANLTESSLHKNNVPSALRKLLPNGLDNLDWKWTGPGIHAAKLESITNGSQLSLLRIQPGKAIASHTHKCDEVTVLLKGSLSDEFGVYQKGDYVLLNNEHEHRPMASNHEECICLTVIETPLHFTGFFMGMLNPVIAKYLA